MKIDGELHYLRGAVDNVGEVPEGQGTKTRDKSAALPLGQPDRVAKPHALSCSLGKGASDQQRALRIRLTPPRGTIGLWSRKWSGQRAALLRMLCNLGSVAFDNQD